MEAGNPQPRFRPRNRNRNSNNNNNQNQANASPTPSGAATATPAAVKNDSTSPIVPPAPASKTQQQQQAKKNNNNNDDNDDYHPVAAPPRQNNNSNNNNRRNNNRNRNNNNSGGYGRKVNTESFDPSHQPPDMRVVVDLGRDKLTTKLSVRDVLLCPLLFTQPGDDTIYDRLVAEMDKCTVPRDRLLKLWHGDNHLIADDRTGFAKECPTFQMVVERIRTFFNMKINATRYNLYRGTDDWKPFHHDAAQFNPSLAKIQNITVGVSFGTTRDADFEEIESKKVIRFPLTNGATYVFGRDLNCMWRHGIPQVAPEKQTKLGRISIIAWGWVDQAEYEKLDI